MYFINDLHTTFITGRKKRSLDQVDTTAAEVYFGKRGKNTRSEIWVTQLEKLWLLVVVSRAGLD